MIVRLRKASAYTVSVPTAFDLMSSPLSNDAPDCTIYCKSTQHGDIINAALSKRSISDFDLCAFLNYTCTRCESVRDSVGRTALHVAASCGRIEVVRWLVCNRHADIDAKDKESGYTALHRSVFYGKIHVAVALIKLGASVTDLDFDSLTVLEHAMKDGLQPENSGGELYSWGSNNNNLLGPQQSRESPELLDVFHKEYPHECVKQICIDEFHCVIITNSGKAFSCGHGQGGRLGLGVEHTVVSPRAISFSDALKGDVIIQASVSRDHSIFLCSDGYVYTCGLNANRVLGIQPPPEKLLVPKQVKHFSNEIKGVCTGRYHSVVWGPKSLYTWGLNAGQLGHKINNKVDEQYVVTPKKVKMINLDEVDIRIVAASDGATAVCTERGDIYILHEHLCRKIASRQLNVIQIGITGGKIEIPSSAQQLLSTKSHWELKVVALTNTGNLLLWQQSDPQLCRCIFSINRAIVVKQVAVNINEVLLVTDYGEAFRGHISQRKKRQSNSHIVEKPGKGNEKSAFHKFLEKDDCILVQLRKVGKIHRAVSIQSDPKGKDFCVIQALPYKFFEFPEIVESEIQKHLESLLLEAHESDNVHDVVFNVGHRNFPAHRFIIAKTSHYFETLFSQNHKKVVVLKDVHDAIFEQFLFYVYAGSCDLTRCGELKNESLRNLCQKLEAPPPNNTDTLDISAYEYYKKTKPSQGHDSQFKNPVRLLQDLAKKFECKELHKRLSNLEMHRYTVKFKHGNEFKDAVPCVKFNRTMFPNLYDVTVKCRDNREIKAHKCILAARLEYFNNMFSMRWAGSETSEVSLPFPKSTAEALLEFLYTDSLSYLNTTDIDHIFKILILADQLFVLRLKEQCELLLTHQLTLKNAVQLLSFADIYNAIKLKHCCMKFITMNFTAFLELRSLDELSDDLLRNLSEFYFQDKQEIWCRVITPYSTAPLDEEIASLTSLHNFSLDDEVELKVATKPSQKRKSRVHKSSLSEKNQSVSSDNDTIIQFPEVPEVIMESTKSIVNVSDRIKSITLASEKIKTEDIESQFTKLSSNRNYDSSNSGKSFNEENDFPQLHSPPHYFSSNSHNKPTQKIDTKHKIVRVSQKQRKRLSSESIPNSTLPESPPKNPWKTIPDIPSLASSPDVKSSITAIISDERKQKENLVKITTKLLSFTQIEDRAIDELHKFYNSDNVTDEIITIERVAIGAIASPVWVPRTKF
ncbi:hypothetical protein NQ315_007157 [Exocentrus adspersus]|uniref:BTB domain-containing protein n=1 Tax=Exocentrus adspersus TaxID=1586481 RepID=A0AAV8WD33_9CUCU|nr:hypothetical protein NQ315_007157 [Exocentrus adspersus]